MNQNEAEKILIIEDDPLVLETLRGVLSAGGYEVEMASSGLEAISKARESDYALIITDVRMPGMDGIEALGKLAAYQPQARKLVITGYAEYDAPVRAIQITVDDYLMKPFGADVLLRSVRNALSRYHLEKQKTDLIRKSSKTVLGVFQFILASVEELHPERKGFCQKLSNLCARIAEELDLGLIQTERVKQAAALHDLGFLPSPQQHNQKGAEILSSVPEYEELASILECHHRKNTDEDKTIPFESKIIEIAEDYCNSEDRQSSPESTLEKLKKKPNKYDPELLSALSRILLNSPKIPPQQALQNSNLSEYERLLRLTQAYTFAGDTEAAKEVLKQMESFPTESLREDLRFRFLLVSAQNLIQQKRFLEGYHVAEKALNIAIASNLGSIYVARAFLELSLTKLCSSNLEQVSEMLEKSNSVFEKFQDSHSQSRALLYLAIYFFLTGQKEKGIGCLDNCLKLIPSDQFEEWLESETVALSIPSGDEFLSYLNSRFPRTKENLRIHLIGPFRVYRKGHLIKEEEWKSKKAKNIFAFLLINKQKPVPEERLCDIFWKDSDFERSKKNLYQCIYLLRHILIPEGPQEKEEFNYILSKRSSYQFNPAISYWCDLEQVTSHFKAAEQFLTLGEKEKAISSFKKIENLCEGELLEDFPSELWCDPERDKLKKICQTAWLQLTLEDEELKRFPQALDRVNHVLSENPLHEKAATQKIRILFKSGQRSEAVRLYHSWCESFKSELNLEPPPELLSLYLEMTSGDLH